MDDAVLAAKLRSWTGDGIITPQQAEDIRMYEVAHPSPTVSVAAGTATQPAAAAPATVAVARPAQQPPVSGEGVRVPMVGEVLGYIGAALALTALSFLVYDSWDVLGTFGQISLATSVAGACLGGGWAVSLNDSATSRRLSNFLFFFGTWAAGVLMGLLAAKSMGGLDTSEWPVSQFPEMVGTFSAFALGAVIWWLRKSSSQLVATTIALAAFIPACFDYSSANQVTKIGLWYLVLGLLWIVAGDGGLLEPVSAAWSLGASGMLLGIQAIGFDSYFSSSLQSGADGPVYLLGVVMGIAFIVVSLWRHRGVGLGMGAAAIVIFLPQMLNALFDDAIGVPVALLFAGVLLVAMSVFVIVMQGKVRGEPLPVAGSSGGR